MNRFLFKHIFYISIIIVFLILVPPMKADQNDLRLEVLFNDLKTSVSIQKASFFEIQIWKIWMEHRNPKVQSSLFLGIEALNHQKFDNALYYFS